jgi:hypothetical protein
MICSPSYATRRRPERPNNADRVARVARLFGLELMPWQRQVIEVATEIDPDSGHPAYRSVGVSTPRQSGKSTLILALLLDRCLLWDRPQACVWTGQDGTSIRKKWLNEIIPDLERSKLAPMIAQVRRANGSEGVEWHTGSRIDLLPSSETAGHGMVLDLCVLDEIFADTDNRREAALLPAMATRADAQMLLCSTAGTAASSFYNRKVKQGRQAVADDTGRGMAYFEWSCPEDWDPDDEESWWGFMPALGHTITPAVIREAKAALADEPAEFLRAFGNRPQIDGGDVIPDRVWRRVVSPDASVGRPVRIAVDVGADRDVAAVAVADATSVELIEYRAGSLDWVVPRLRELVDRWGCPVVFDARGPASGLAGLDVLPRVQGLGSNEVAEACSRFFDGVADSLVSIRQEPQLDAGVKGLVRRPVGDRFVWSRKGSRRDVTGLYAATLAWAASVDAPVVKPVFAF